MLSKHMFPLFLLVCLSFFPSSSCLHFQNVQTMFRLGEMRSHLVYFVTSLGRKDTPFTEGILEILVMMAVEWLVGWIVFSTLVVCFPFPSFPFTCCRTPVNHLFIHLCCCCCLILPSPSKKLPVEQLVCLSSFFPLYLFYSLDVFFPSPGFSLLIFNFPIGQCLNTVLCCLRFICF